MNEGTALDRDLVPDRIANALPFPLIESLHFEAAQIRRAEAALHMRRVVLVTKLRENGMSWDSCGWFFGATGEAVRKFYSSLIGDQDGASDSKPGGKPNKA